MFVFFSHCVTRLKITSYQFIVCRRRTQFALQLIFDFFRAIASSTAFSCFSSSSLRVDFILAAAAAFSDDALSFLSSFVGVARFLVTSTGERKENLSVARFKHRLTTFSPFDDGFRSTTIFSRFFFPFESLVLDEYEESDSLPLVDPDPDELSRFFLLCAVRLFSGRV